MGGPTTFKGTGNSLEAVTSFHACPPAAPLTSSLVIHLFASCPISLHSVLHIAARRVLATVTKYRRLCGL